MDTERLVDDYLRRLEAAAAHLQRSRRAELVAEIREHIEAALREEDAANEVAVRNVLERLGPPEEIVDAAEPPATESPARAGRLEIAALIALVVPFTGWLIGIVLVVASRAWSGRDKAVGVALALLPALVPLLGIVGVSAEGGAEPIQEPASGPPELVGSDITGPGGPAHSERSTDEGLGVAELALLAFFFLGGLPSALYLGWRLRRRPAA
jgi:hypothetical protein